MVFLALAGAAHAATTTDRIVARVNNDVITLSELNAQVKAVRQNQRGALPPGPTIESQVLDSMIEIELINQVARRDGIMVPEEEIDGAIDMIRNENNITDAQFRASLKQSGISLPDFRGNLRNELIKEKVLRLNIYQKIVVTEAEVDQFLSGEGPDMTGLYVGGSVESDKVRFLFLASSPNRANSVVERAMTIKREIEAGLTFAEAARRYSQGPGSDNGGDTGTTIGELVPQLKAVALSMAPGQVSEPLDGGQVVLMLYVDPRPDGASPASASQGGGPADLAGFSPQQRDMARRQLEQIKLRKKYETWLTDLKGKANIKITM